MKGIATVVLLAFAALVATSAAAAPAPKTARLVDVAGVARIDGHPALVDVLLAVPQGRTVAAARTAALRREHAIPAFAFSGWKWQQFLDHDPTNDTVQQLYDPTGDPTGSASDTLTSAAATWSAVPGSSFRLQTAGTSAETPGTLDYKNVVGWSADPATFPPGVLAVTTTFFNKAIGALLDADIVLNANVTWSTATDGPPPGAYDLQTALTHEDGHLAGLAHSLDPSAVMYFNLLMGESRRTLGQDDVDAITTLYPTLSCRVPELRTKRLGVATRLVTSAGCSVGNVHRVFSRHVRRGIVVSQKPAAGSVWTGGTKVSFVVSKGRKKRA